MQLSVALWYYVSMELSRVATKELVRELLHRPDLRKPEGLLEPELFELREALGAIPCVDGIPVRRRNSTLEVVLGRDMPRPRGLRVSPARRIS